MPVAVGRNSIVFAPRIGRHACGEALLGCHPAEPHVCEHSAEIAAEVLSPSETPRMIHRKMKQYFEAGVKEVWLIDPESREVEIWIGLQLTQELTGDAAISSPLLPGFSLKLEELFS